jgi:hypothetical protein
MNLVGPGNASHRDMVTTGPIRDVRGLLAEAAAAGLDPHRDAFVSFHLRFTDRSAWERAGQFATTDGWEVSAYSRPHAHMLRLSRPAPLTETAVEHLRAAIVAFAADNDATWESVAIEGLAQTNTWKAIAEQRTGSHDDAEPAAERLEQDSDGGEVA